MSQIRISNLTFTYEGSPDPVFENLDLILDTDWKLGLVGRNGRGKTTLLKLLLGGLPFSGSIASHTSFSYFPYPVRDPQQSLREVLLEIYPGESWALERELSLMQLDPEDWDLPFCALSPGQQTKALLAAMFLDEDSFKLIDEPTNHLDLRGREQVARYLRGKRGFLLVSHDRSVLDQCADHILALTQTGAEVVRGNFSSWWEEQRRREQFEAEQNRRLKADIDRLSEAARRAGEWSHRAEKGKHRTADSDGRPERGYAGHKAAKMMKRAKSIQSRREEAVEQKSHLLRNVETAEPLKLHPLPYPRRRLLLAEDLCAGYGERTVLSHLSFSLEQGDRLAITGPNGSGKSTLLSLLAGEISPQRGKLLIGSGLIVSYVPQKFSFLEGSLEDFVRTRNLDGTLFRTILRKLGFAREQFSRDLAEFSDGQKKKALLAASLAQRAHLYLWDEPLNFIDLYSRIQLEALLEEFQPTIAFVEHDRAFVDRVANRTLAL